MNSLSFNPATGAFIFRSRNASGAALAREIGLDRSVPASSPGEDVYFTRDEYAALPLWEMADDAARDALFLRHIEYAASMETEWKGGSLLCPDDRDYMPFQKAGIRYALERPHALIGDEPGLGKAQPLWARVLTPRGWKAMGDLRVGDAVSGYDGKYGRVTAVYDRGVMDVYRVRFNDGAECYASADHLWRMRAREVNDWFVGPTWEMADRLARGLRVEVPLAAPVVGIEGVPPVSAYLVGLLLGDGGLSQQSVYLSSVDEPILSRCRKIARLYDVELVHSDRCTYRFSSGSRGRPNKLKRLLDSLGMMGHTGHTKRVPFRYMHGNRKTRLEVLRGLMDSDGWVCENGANTGFASVSEGLVDDVVALVRSLGGVARKSKKAVGWSLSVNMSVCPFWLPRKAEQWAPYKSYTPRRLVASVELFSTEPVRCIAVSCRDRLYITDDYVVTHNTIQAIGVANEMKARRVLVICPASVRLQWRKEVRAWSMFPRPIVYPVLKAGDGINPHAHYTIISYDLARHAVLHGAMRKMHFDLLVLDEAHYLKTWDALRTRAVFGDGEAHDERFFLGLAGCAEKIVGLTGTPLPNRPRECYTVARHLCWDSIDWMSEDKFRWRYNPSASMPSGYVKEMTGRLPELRCRLRCNFMVRRHKKDVLKDLPDKRYELAYVEENGQIREALKAEKMLDIDPLDLKGLDAEILGQISTVRRMMGLAKVGRVGEHVAMLLDGGIEKLVVFAHHREVISKLQERLARYGCVAVHGAVSPVARAKAVLAFQSEPKCKVFIGQLQAAGTGLDGLQQVCSHVVFAEADWVPGTNEQCVDRLHRHGQKGAVLAKFLVAPGSLDEKVLGSAIAKAHTVFETLDSR